MRRGSPGCRRRESASPRCGPGWPASGPRPPRPNDGIVEMVCAATPVNSARASSPRSRPHAGLPWASTRRPARTVVARSGGRDRLSPRKNPSAPSTVACQRAQETPPRRADLELRAGARQVVVADRGRPVREWISVGDFRGRTVARRGRAGRTPPGTVTPAPAGARPSRCRGPRRSIPGRAAVRAPPPSVGWASNTCTDNPARAQMTAAAKPLGPLPTTVTSTPQLKPIRLAG